MSQSYSCIHIFLTILRHRIALCNKPPLKIWLTYFSLRNMTFNTPYFTYEWKAILILMTINHLTKLIDQNAKATLCSY